MVGSTEAVARLNRDVARDYFDYILKIIDDCITSFGGEVIKTQGDGVKAVFGHEKSLEDHAIRAAFAGVKIIKECRAKVPLFAKDVKFRGLRAGLHSGYAIVSRISDEQSDRTDTFGLTTHIAAKMEECAPIDRLCISAATKDLVGEHLTATRHELVFMGDGIDPVPSFLVSQDADTEKQSFSKINAAANEKLFGRELELEKIERAFDFSESHRPKSVLICGAAGIGKSKLISETSDRLQARKIQYVVASGLDLMTDTPFFILKNWFRALYPKYGTGFTSLEQEALDILLSSDGTKMKKWEISQNQKIENIHAVAIRLLTEALQRGPLVVIAEDLHFFDAESLEFLRRLMGEKFEDKDLVILATSRTHQPAEPKFDLELFLEPLDTSDSIALAKSVSERFSLDYKDNFVSEIVERSGGVPLILTQLMRLKFSNQSEQDKSAIPVSLEPILRQRLEQLSEDGFTLSNYMSLIGHPTKTSLLSDLTTWSEDRLSEALKDAVDNGIFTQISDHEFKFTHDLFRIACENSLTQKQKTKLHENIYDVLHTGDQDQIDIFSLARQAFGAGKPENGLGHFKKAMARANELGAIRTVRSLFEQVSEYCELLEAPGLHKARFAMLSFDATHRLAEERHLIKIFTEALETFEDQYSSEELIVMRSQLSLALWTNGESGRALPYASQAMRDVTSTNHLGLECIAVYTQACIEFSSGYLASAVTRVQRHVKKIPEELALKKWGQSVTFPSIVLRTFGAWFATDHGNIELAETWVENARKTEADNPNTYAQVLIGLADGYLHFRRQDYTRGAEILCDIYEVAKTSTLSLAPMVAAWAALCSIETGALDKAQNLIDNEFASGRYKIIRNCNRHYLFLAKAKLLAANGKTDDAKTWLNKILNETAANGDLVSLAYGHAAFAELKTGENLPNSDVVRHLKNALAISEQCGMRPLAVMCKESLEKA